MYIVYKESDIEQLRSKYLLLEVDTLKITNEETITGYCVIDIDHINLNEITTLKTVKEAHENLMDSYKSQNWDFCIDIIDELKGNFKGELDSFYDVLLDRIVSLQNQSINVDWTGVVDVSDSSKIG